jgi:hypothetical protein
VLINKTLVKRRILSVASTRAHSFTRVSGLCYIYLDRMVGEMIERLVANQPNKGKTITTGGHDA